MTDLRTAASLAISGNVTDRRRISATAVALTFTVGLAAAAWVASVWQMSRMNMGMSMGTATDLGSFGLFAALWVSMMAAMMLPGAAPALVRRAQASGDGRAVPPFVASYLAVWTAIGVLVYWAYRPHGTGAAGAVVIAAGIYELTPLKRLFRQRGRYTAQSGSRFGICCVGSSVGLMVILLAVGVMSIPWMAVIAAVVIAQKLLPPKAAIDVPLALAIVALGSWILAAPSSVPGLVPAM
jgi:predicted metal-binding membrane protein